MLDQQVFQADMLTDETILWTGRPDPSIHLLLRTFPSFSFFLPGKVELSFLQPLRSLAGLGFFSIFLLMIFACLGLSMIFSRFVLPTWRKKRTHYAVTDKRVLALTTTTGGRTLETRDIHTLPGMQTSVRRNGTGTITFGNPGGTEWGMTFSDIQDVQQVYELVNDIRNTRWTSF